MKNSFDTVLNGRVVDPFTKVFQKPMEDVWGLMQRRELMPMDVIILMYLATNTDVKTGRAYIRTKDIAANLNYPVNRLSSCMKRLREKRYLGKGLTATGYYWMVAPDVASVGRDTLHVERTKQFNELLPKA
jgi:hypothetical protein